MTKLMDNNDELTKYNKVSAIKCEITKGLIYYYYYLVALKLNTGKHEFEMD